MPDPPATTVIERVTRRFDVVDRLAGSTLELRDLRDDLDVSRSTAYKAVRELEEVGIAARTDDGVALTPFGRLAYDSYARFASDLEAMAGLEPYLPEGNSLELPPEAFYDGDVVCARRNDPDRPLDAFEDLVRESDRFRGFSPAVRSRYADLFRERVLEGDLGATILTEPTAVEVLLAELGDATSELLGAEDFEFGQTDRSLPFGLACLGDPVERVVVGLYDERQHLAGILVNDSPPAIEWGRRTYEAVLDDAVPLDPAAPRGEAVDT